MPDRGELAGPSASAPGREGFWSNVREALRGSDRDYTRGPIGRAIFLLAIPMVLEMAMESVFAVTDVFFVGRLGPDAVATIGLTESMLTLVYALAMGLGIGTTAVVARRVGEKDREGAANAAVQATALGIAGAVLLGGLGVTFAPRLLALMRASPAVLQVGSGYTPVMRTVARLSGSGARQSIIGMASWIGLVRIVATFGSQALAGYTIGIRIVIFALLPSWGMSNAAATMVGQALGARDPDRAERAV